MKIAKIKELYFEAPHDSWYSFFNSPYSGHKHGTAIDVYYPYGIALFPFEEGRVKEIKKIRTPQHVPVEIDYLTFVKIKDFCLKILHVKPSVKVGETLYLGDEIGEMIISGFFLPWSDMHAHFELRDCKDRYRARGGFLIEPTVSKLVPSIKGSEFEIVERKEQYYWLKCTCKRGKNLTPLTYQGMAIEGGLPYYHYGAVFGNLDEIEIFDKKIQLEKKLLTRVGLFETKFEVFTNDQKVKGIGIYCNQEKIKLIGGEFREGEIITLQVLSE